MMLPEDLIRHLTALAREDDDTLCPAEKLLLLGIDPFPRRQTRQIRAKEADEDEYNDDFDDEPGTVDEEPYEDYSRDSGSYVYDDDEYDLAELKECPFLRAVLLYNNNRRKYYC